MRKTVFMYMGTGIAEPENSSGFVPHQKHPLLVFLADYSNDYNWKRAEEVAMENGWRSVDFTKVGKITPDMIAQQDPTMRERYADAVASGSAFIAYAAVEED
ncbi:MAG: hypothetical protein AAF420_14260 [Pseudomonadota bacterium]